jgi:NAD(P)H-hydrate epimerase
VPWHLCSIIQRTLFFCSASNFATIAPVSVPIINSAAMREWEAATWMTGQTEAEVIRQVGSQIARRAGELTRDHDLIIILAGKGHNGDDARAAAHELPHRRVKVLDFSNPDPLPLELLLKEKPALIIDGLFGIGLNRPLEEPWLKIIAAINATKIPVLAVDVPSGLNSDTGASFGAAVQASITLTVGAPKSGLLTADAWPFVGRLEVADQVGLIPCPLASELNWTLPQDFQNFPPRRPVAAHKGSLGHVVILAGSLGYHGAAVLSTRGAQRAQPGLATVFTQENVYPVVATQLQSAMVKSWRPDADFPETMTSLLVGPGLAAPGTAESIRRALQRWWRDLDCPIVVDASALEALAAGPFTKKEARVLTPHPGEAARLLNWSVPKVQANRVAALRELSQKYGGAWIVLKGHQTLVGRMEGDIFVNCSGNPHLAQGGSGDLLAGFIAGLIAQPSLQSDLACTLRYAVWQHGAAADQLQALRPNWTIEDLATELGNVRPSTARW